VDAVRRVARGLPVLSPAVTRRLIARVAGPGHDRRTRARERLAQLNEREREVAVAVGQGRSNAEIGAALYLSVPTVKTHVSSILTKLDLNNRVQIALLAHDAGLLRRPGLRAGQARPAAGWRRAPRQASRSFTLAPVRRMAPS
jgi:DNA-binding NarL/FixJ family response regulator